jgi:hypothetical protein
VAEDALDEWHDDDQYMGPSGQRRCTVDSFARNSIGALSVLNRKEKVHLKSSAGIDEHETGFCDPFLALFFWVWCGESGARRERSRPETRIHTLAQPAPQFLSPLLLRAARQRPKQQQFFFLATAPFPRNPQHALNHAVVQKLNHNLNHCEIEVIAGKELHQRRESWG